MQLNAFNASEWAALARTPVRRPTRTGPRTPYDPARWTGGPPAPPSPSQPSPAPPAAPAPPPHVPPPKAFRVKLRPPEGKTAQECQAAYARLSHDLRRAAPGAYAAEVMRHSGAGRQGDSLLLLDCVGEPLDLSNVPLGALDELLELVGHGQWQLAFSEGLQFYP